MYIGGAVAASLLGLLGCDMFNHAATGRSYFRDLATAFSGITTNNSSITNNTNVQQYGAVNRVILPNTCSCNLDQGLDHDSDSGSTI